MSLLDRIIDATGANREGREYRGRCPVCGGDNLTFSENKEGSERWPAFTGYGRCACEFSQIVAAFEAQGIAAASSRTADSPAPFYNESGASPPRPSRREQPKTEKPAKARPADAKLSVITYTDAAGKEWKQSRWDWIDANGNTDKDCRFELGTPATGLVYGLAEVIASKPDTPVFWVESPKKVDALRSIGARAISGASASSTVIAPALAALRGREVYIWGDNDRNGRKHARHVAEKLYDIAREVWFVEWPDAPEGGDAATFLAQYNTRDEKILAVKALLNDCTLAPIPAPSGSESVADFIRRARRGGLVLRFGVGGLLPLGGITTWHGRPRSMKSLTAQFAAVSMAAGVNILGEVSRPLRVLYVNEEDGEQMVAQRFAAILGALDLDETPEGLHVKVRTGWNLETPEGQKALLADVEANESDVVILDPIRAFMPKIDAGPADAAPGVAYLREIQRETSAETLLLIHHDVKPQPQGKDDRSRSEKMSGGVTLSISEAPVSFERANDTTCNVRPALWKSGATPPGFTLSFEFESDRMSVQKVEADETTMRSTQVAREILGQLVEGQPVAKADVIGRGGDERASRAPVVAALVSVDAVGETTGPKNKKFLTLRVSAEEAIDLLLAADARTEADGFTVVAKEGPQAAFDFDGEGPGVGDDLDAQIDAAEREAA